MRNSQPSVLSVVCAASQLRQGYPFRLLWTGMNNLTDTLLAIRCVLGWISERVNRALLAGGYSVKQV
jgi:hypothetical protein